MSHPQNPVRREVDPVGRDFMQLAPLPPASTALLEKIEEYARWRVQEMMHDLPDDESTAVLEEIRAELVRWVHKP